MWACIAICYLTFWADTLLLITSVPAEFLGACVRQKGTDWIKGLQILGKWVSVQPNRGDQANCTLDTPTKICSTCKQNPSPIPWGCLCQVLTGPWCSGVWHPMYYSTPSNCRDSPLKHLMTPCLLLCRPGTAEPHFWGCLTPLVYQD